MPAGRPASSSRKSLKTPGSRSRRSMRSSSTSPRKSAYPRRCNYSASITRGCRMNQGMPERSARTVLAFDFGLKRIGVAVGEPELRTAHPLPPIAAPGFDSIGKLVAEWHPAQLVVGLPVAAQGAHPLAKKVERFARQLEGRFRLPVARVDERFSSVEAESRLKGTKRKSIDSVAAQLILEQYFDQAAGIAS